jgi:hypothetical protein
MSDAVRFVVRRLNWRPAGDRFIRLPGESRLASFDTFDAAEADRAARESEVRDRVNPFRCGTAWHALTTIPEPMFRDWVADVGLTPAPVPGPEAWVAWWAEGHEAWTAEQRWHVWAGLNRVRFFEVIERPASTVAFAVVRVMWQYNDQWYEPGSEGGGTVRAYRDRERAEAECRRLEERARREWDDRYRVETWRWESDRWPALNEEEGIEEDEAFDRRGARLYEVVEIDVGEGAP